MSLFQKKLADCILTNIIKNTIIERNISSYKGVIRSRNSKNKQWWTKFYTET